MPQKHGSTEKWGFNLKSQVQRRLVKLFETPRLEEHKAARRNTAILKRLSERTTLFAFNKEEAMLSLSRFKPVMFCVTLSNICHIGGSLWDNPLCYFAPFVPLWFPLLRYIFQIPNSRFLYSPYALNLIPLTLLLKIRQASTNPSFVLIIIYTNHFSFA